MKFDDKLIDYPKAIIDSKHKLILRYCIQFYDEEMKATK